MYQKSIKLYLLLNTLIFSSDALSIDIENVSSHAITPVAKFECSSQELYTLTSSSDRYKKKNNGYYKQPTLLHPSTDMPTAQLKDLKPAANHIFYDFSQMEPTRAPQNIGLNFTAVTSSECPMPLSIVPDTMLGVGPTQILAVGNFGIISYDKTTGQQDYIIETPLAAAFNRFIYQPIFTGPFQTFDPRIRYDRFSDRWFLMAVDITFIPQPVNPPLFLPNNILIAMSDTGVISKTTKWTGYIFAQNQIFPPGDLLNWADAPSLGIDAHALYIGSNMVIEVLPASASLFVFPKAGLINGNPVGTAFRGFAGINGPVGVDNFDPNPVNGFFIAMQQQEPPVPATSMFLFIIDNPATTPLLAGIIPILIDPATSAPDAPHKGKLPNGQLIFTLDPRLMHAHIWNNQLYTSHDVGVDQTGNFLVPDRCAIRWYQIDVSSPLSPVLIQQSTFFDASLINPRFFYFSALMTNMRGDLVIGCSTSATDQFVDAMTLGRLATDPLNTLQAPTFLTNTQFAYNYMSNIDSGSVSGSIGAQRWGDYSYTALDPDNMTMWTAQEFCARTDNWGIQIAQLLAP